MHRVRGYTAALGALLGLVLLHEGGHALAGAFWGETVGFRAHAWGLGGFEVLFQTPVAERGGVRWAVISGLPNLLTVGLGYVLYVLRRRGRDSGRAVAAILYWGTLLLLLADPLNLSFGPFLYGGDAVGIAVGLGVPVLAVQAVALGVLLVNRELVVRGLLPLWGIETRHPLLRPWPYRGLTGRGGGG
jgi:hypothetical protein